MSISNFGSVQVVPLTAAEINFSGNTGGYICPFNTPGTHALITVPALGFTGAIYLPPASSMAGSTIDIRSVGTVGHALYIYSATGTANFGGIVNQSTTVGPTGSANFTSASCTITSGSVLGDSVKITSDGLHYIIDATTSVAAGITIP